MRISVAMCTFQGERYLEQQMASIAAQARVPDEVVVHDDGSSDRTREIVEHFAAWAPFPVEFAVNPKRLGVTGNYEGAIGACRGDVIVLADQDDIWLPHRLAAMEEAFSDSKGALLAFSDAFLIRPDGRPTGDHLWKIAGFSPAQQRRMRQDPFGQLMGRSIVSGCTLAFRSSCRDLLLPFPSEHTASDMRVLHDRWISIVLAAAGNVAVISDPLVAYRIHPAQQVGIPALQIRKVVPSSLLRWRSAAVPTLEHTARLQAMVELLEMVAKRLDAGLTGQKRELALGQLREAMDHIQARAAVSGPRLARLGSVVREALTGRYHRYSLGTASALADVVRLNSRT